MSIQLNIGANVQPAVDGVKTITNVLDDFARKGKLSINVIEKSMQDLRVAIKQSTDPTEITKLKSAFTELQARLNSLKLEGGLTQQLGGVTRAARLAHSDLEGVAQSIRGLATGSERGIDALSNIAFTFERLKGVSGGVGGALSAIGETLLGPAGLILAFTTIGPLIADFITKLFESSDAAEANKKVLDDLAISIADVKKETENLTTAVDFANRLGAINVKITGLGDLEDLRQQSTENQQLIVKLGEETQKARENLNKAELADDEQKTKESKKIREEALTALNESFKKEAEANEKQRIILAQIRLQKKVDQKKADDEQLKQLKEAQAELQREVEEGQRKLAALIKEVAPSLFEIPVKLQFSKLDTQKQEIDKALKIIAGIRDLTIPIKIAPKLDFHGKEFEPPKIEDLPIDLSTVGIDFKGKDKFDDRLQEGLSKGIIIPITPQVRVEDLKGVPSSDQEKILVDLTKQFAIFGDVGRHALQKINFSDPADQIKAMQKELLTLTIQFNDIKTISESVGQAFGDAFLSITKGENPIKAFFSSIIHSLEQLIAKLIATKIAAALLNAFLPGSNFGLKALSLVIPGRAEGGPVEGGKLHVVGERGPELFVPQVSGKIIPNHQIKSFAENNFSNAKNISSVINKSSFSDISKTVNNFYHSTTNNVVANKSVKSFSLNDSSPTNNVAAPNVVDFSKQLKSNYFINNLVDVSKFSASLPHLQTGGITTSDTIAQLHKAEAIMPLDRLPSLLGNKNANGYELHSTEKVIIEGENIALALDRYFKRKGRSF